MRRSRSLHDEVTFLSSFQRLRQIVKDADVLGLTKSWASLREKSVAAPQIMLAKPRGPPA
jgi:hypothetical protein